MRQGERERGRKQKDRERRKDELREKDRDIGREKLRETEEGVIFLSFSQGRNSSPLFSPLLKHFSRDVSGKLSRTFLSSL